MGTFSIPPTDSGSSACFTAVHSRESNVARRLLLLPALTLPPWHGPQGLRGHGHGRSIERGLRVYPRRLAAAASTDRWPAHRQYAFPVSRQTLARDAAYLMTYSHARPSSAARL